MGKKRICVKINMPHGVPTITWFITWGEKQKVDSFTTNCSSLVTLPNDNKNKTIQIWKFRLNLYSWVSSLFQFIIIVRYQNLNMKNTCVLYLTRAMNLFEWTKNLTCKKSLAHRFSICQLPHTHQWLSLRAKECKTYFISNIGMI